MRWKSWTRAALLGLTGLVTASTMGCAEERPPINRVQADALAKSFFVGQDLVDHSDNPKFYANGTLMDIGYGAAQSALFSAWYANDLSVIKWEITEDFLLGRLAYERIEGSDGKGAGAESNDGQVIYVFRIMSHFDIKRAYNPTTGEEMNVVEENMSDRPWYEREYFRVDWSQNLNTDGYDYDLMALLGILDGVKYEPIAYYVNDPAHPHAPHFDADDGYFDITTKSFAAPQMIDISHLGWGLSTIPACWLDADIFNGTAPAANCNPTELTIRNSFWRVEDRDYEPSDWDGYKFQAFGAFTKDRYGFARNYGMSDTEWRRFISRYNIWDRSHYYSKPEKMTGPVECYTPNTTPIDADPNRDDDGDGTADECIAAGSGSQCDTFKQKCTLPFRERSIRPVEWYYTTGSDLTFWQGTQWATQEWDIAIRLAAQTAKYAECQRTGGGEACDQQFPVIHGQMSQMRDVVDVTTAVDDCRMNDLASRCDGSFGDCVGRYEEDSLAACKDQISSILGARGYQPGTTEYASIEALANMADTVVLCHSPVEATDHPYCAPGRARLPKDISASDCSAAMAEGGDANVRAECKEAFNVRMGDVRFHQINIISDPESPSPWGFGPTFADPLTGESISASINVWTWPTDFISQNTVDIARYIAGELSTADVTEGEFVKDWALAARVSGSQGALPPMRKAELNDRKREAIMAATRDLETGENTDIAELPEKVQLPPELLEGAKEIGKLRSIRASATAPTTSSAVYRARREQAQGTVTEAELTTPAMMQLAGVENLPADAAAQFASPLRGLNPTQQRELHNLMEERLAARGACMLGPEEAPSPTAMVGMTEILQQKFGAFNASDPLNVQLERAERMRAYLAQRMHYAVIIHEMGHTFGYRHNFVSSSSAFNYRPQYWQLRTRDGEVSTACEDLTESDDEARNCVGPRYFDQMTPEERDNLIWMWMHSSVMDYAGEITQDMLGLGAYDWAAARMFYGETATVYSDEDMKEGTNNGDGIRETIMDSFGGILGYTYQWGPAVFVGAGDSRTIHYSQLQNYYKLIQNCQPIDPEAYRPANWDEATQGVWHPTFDGLLVQPKGNGYTRCQQRSVDYVPWGKLQVREAGFGVAPAVDQTGRTRVPYPFATDTWADTGNLAVFRHDNGADPYELFNFLITEQEVKHVFDNYRRNRQTFSVRSASNRILGRYNEKMRDAAKGMGLIANSLRDTGLKIGIQPADFMNAYVAFWGWGDNLLASGVAFDHFARQLQRPQAGAHGELTIANPITNYEKTDWVLRFGEGSDVIVPNGAQGFWSNVGMGGKLVENQLADNRGEYDTEFTMNAGSYYDKVWSPMLMTESADNFISAQLDDFIDARARSISMADLFPDGFRRYLANNLTNDDWVKAPRVAAASLGAPLTDPEGFPSQPIGWTSWWPQQPEMCFANNGTTVCSATDGTGDPFKVDAPSNMRPIDPQVGWEQQKFLIAMTLIYLPANQKQKWLDMMNIWELGPDSDPSVENRIEFHHPSGDIYVARTYGTEDICYEASVEVPTGCKTVQRGISARILEYANELLASAYVTTPVTQNGVTWYVPVISASGAPIVKFDPSMSYINGDFSYKQLDELPVDCRPDELDPDDLDADWTTYEGCECQDNLSCMHLEDYTSVVQFMRQSMRDFRMDEASMKGIYD